MVLQLQQASVQSPPEGFLAHRLLAPPPEVPTQYLGRGLGTDICHRLPGGAAASRNPPPLRTTALDGGSLRTR